jgi:4-hydroxybenzoate polyprenyltransferase
VISTVLVATIVLYDVILKATPVAPVVMGLCRAMNLILGMSAAPMLWTNTTLFPTALMWLYITSVTLFARSETRTGGHRRLGFGAAGVCAAVGGLVGLLWILPEARLEYLFLVGVLLGLLGYRGYRAVTNAQPTPVQRAVKTFVLSLILFDTCIAAAARGPVTALIVAVMLLPGIALGRLFRVT